MSKNLEINLFLNFEKDFTNNTQLFTYEESDVLQNTYRHACGKAVIDFYLDPDIPESHHVSDNTWYLRYANVIKDRDDVLEQWLNRIAKHIIQVNGHHVGTVFDMDREELFLVQIQDEKAVFTKLTTA